MPDWDNSGGEHPAASEEVSQKKRCSGEHPAASQDMSQKKRRTGSSLDCQDSELEFPHPAITLVDGLIRWKGSNSYEREWQFFKKLQGSPHTYSDLQMQYRTLSQQAQEHWKKLYEDFWCFSCHPPLTLVEGHIRKIGRAGYEDEWTFFRRLEGSTLTVTELRQQYRSLSQQSRSHWKKLYEDFRSHHLATRV